eukprot:6212857-Prymnesium_polylepis.2
MSFAEAFKEPRMTEQACPSPVRRADSVDSPTSPFTPQRRSDGSESTPSPFTPRKLFRETVAEVSPVRVAIVTFGALSAIEGIAVVIGTPLPPAPFAALFLLQLFLRIRLSSHPDAILWWPVANTMFASLLVDRFVHRPRGDLIKRLRKHVKDVAVSWALHNPVRTWSMISKGLRLLRWVAWGIPLWGLVMNIKKNLERNYILRKQRRQRERKARALAE